MKKTILFIFICLLGIGNVSAQFSTIPYTGSNQQLRATQADIFKFGYSSNNIQDGLGTGALASLSAAIYIPNAKYGAYAGKTISTINIGLGEASTNVSVWIKSDLNGANLIEKWVGAASEGWNEITLDSPFTIPEGDIYIGYTATARYQIGVSVGDVKDNEGWLKASSYSWEDIKKYGYILCIQAYIDLPEGPIFDLGIDQLNKSQAIINKATNVSAVLRNVSPETTITSLKYAYEIGEQPAVEKTITTNIAPNSLASVNLPIDPISVAGAYDAKVTILEINGQPDTFTANNSAIGSHQVVYQLYPKKVIVEEGTGTWCTWCPRGTVGMNMMKERYPESFIGIAVHNGRDYPMTVPTYDSFMTSRYFTGFPMCVVNRKMELVGDPYYDIETFFLSEMESEALAGVELSAKYADENKTQINLTSVVTFGLPEENANYRLSYVLIENGVTGTGSGYEQINAYAGGAYGPMGGYENKPSRITDEVYSKVARGIYTTAGVANSIPQSITELVPITHDYTITLPTNIQDKDNVELIVMLLDKNREVVNADKVYLGGSTVGINPVSKEENNLLTNIHKSKETLSFTINANDAVTIGLYDISGRLISSEVKSINGTETITLPVNDLNGVYLLKAQTKDKVSTKKVVL